MIIDTLVLDNGHNNKVGIRTPAYLKPAIFE